MSRQKKPIVRSRGGRPALYNQKTAQRICELIAKGVTASEICTRAGMPKRATLFYWLHQHEEFARAYSLARQCRAEDIFDGNLRLAEDAHRTVKRSKNDAEVRKGEAVVKSARLCIDTGFKMVAMLAPKKYGRLLEDPLLPITRPAEDDDDGGDGDTVAQIPAPQPSAPPVVPLEQHPLYNSLMAWERVAKSDD